MLVGEGDESDGRAGAVLTEAELLEMVFGDHTNPPPTPTPPVSST